MAAVAKPRSASAASFVGGRGTPTRGRTCALWPGRGRASLGATVTAVACPCPSARWLLRRAREGVSVTGPLRYQTSESLPSQISTVVDAFLRNHSPRDAARAVRPRALTRARLPRGNAGTPRSRQLSSLVTSPSLRLATAPPPGPPAPSSSRAASVVHLPRGRDARRGRDGHARAARAPGGHP